MKKPYHRWKDLREKRLTPAQLERIDRAVERELVEMNLHAIRELVGQTQEEVAAVIDMSQSEVLRLERRQDVRMSQVATNSPQPDHFSRC